MPVIRWALAIAIPIALGAITAAVFHAPGILFFAALYWLPTAIAIGRRVPGLGQVIVVNALLGWSVIGWIAALVMAFRHGDRPAGLTREES
jgi:Superinfection immunity protein